MARSKSLPVVEDSTPAEEVQETEQVEFTGIPDDQAESQLVTNSAVDPEGAQLVVGPEDNVWLMAAGPHEVFNPYSSERFSVGKPVFVTRVDGYIKTQLQAGLLLEVDPTAVMVAKVGTVKEI